MVLTIRLPVSEMNCPILELRVGVLLCKAANEGASFPGRPLTPLIRAVNKSEITGAVGQDPLGRVFGEVPIHDLHHFKILRFLRNRFVIHSASIDGK